MKIIIKPLGLIVLLCAILLLSVLAFRGRAGHNAAQEMSSIPPVIVANTTPRSGSIASPSAILTPPASDSLAPAAVRGQSIYRDGMENGWETVRWTWAKDVTFDDTTRPRSGTKAIRVHYSGFDGVKFHHAPLNTRPFDRISFYVNGGDTGGQRIAVGAACAEKNVANGVKLAALPANKWVAVTIPLRKIALADRPDMTSFWIQGNSSKPQNDLYIDEVRLLKPGEPGPSGPSLALAP